MLKVNGILLFLLLLLFASPVGAQEQNRIVAIVGKEIITQFDLDKAVSRLESHLFSALPPGRPRPSAQEIKGMALDGLIENMVFKQIVERENLSMNDAELDRQVASMLAQGKASEHELAAELSLRGMTMQEYREELRQDILKRRLIDRLVRSRVVISEQQVDQYIAANAGNLVPGEMHLQAIFLPIPSDSRGQEQMRQVAQKLYQQLKEGADFAKLATEFSQGPGAGQGGDLGKININDMLPNMRAAVEKLKPGEISQPVPLPDNYVIFKRIADSARNGATSMVSEAQRRQVREILEKEALDKRFKQWMQQVRSEIYVKIIDN